MPWSVRRTATSRASPRSPTPTAASFSCTAIGCSAHLHDAEDLLQETLIAAWRGLSGFERRASLRSWLYTIATNRCLNALRDAGRRPVSAAVSAGGALSGGAENFPEIGGSSPTRTCCWTVSPMPRRGPRPATRPRRP